MDLNIHTCNILWNNINLDLSNLVYDFLDVEVQESIEGRNLLRYQPVLREIAPDDRPCIILVDVVKRQAVVSKTVLRLQSMNVLT